MNKLSKKTTIYFEPHVYQDLKTRETNSYHSISDIVNKAVNIELKEYQEDFRSFDERADEPIISHEDLLASLKAHGKL